MLLLLFALVLGSWPVFAAYSEPIKIADKLSESFEGLTGLNNTPSSFVQGKSVKGWFSSESMYIASDGSSNVGGLYSFGASPDRALGAVNSNAKKTVVFGISIVSDVEIHEVDVKFTGEQWRYGGDVPDNDVLTFDFCVLSTEQYQNGGWGGIYVQNTAPWMQVPQLSFYGTNATATGPVRFLQRFARSLQTPGMGPDKVLQLRWTARSNHDGLAIDDFEIHATKDTGGAGTPSNKWKTIGIAAISALGLTVVGIIVFAITRWKKHRKEAEYRHIYPDVSSSQSSIRPPGAYKYYTEKDKLVA